MHDNFYFYCALPVRTPGWGQKGYWQYNASMVEVPELGTNLHNLTFKLYKGEFRNEEERREWMRLSAKYCALEGLRIWIASVKAIYAVNPEMRNMVRNKLGFWYTLNLYTVTVPGKDELRMGTMGPTTVSWNPWNIVVNAWIYDYITMSPTTGMAIMRDPDTGHVKPFQCTYLVMKGPINFAAYKWDDEANKWVKVNGVAKYSVTFNCKLGWWHSGVPVSMWDLIYMFYIPWEWGVMSGNESDGVFYDSSYAGAAEPFLASVLGVDVINETSFIVYTNYSHFDINEIAAFVATMPDLPLEVYWAMEKLFAEGKAAPTEQTASKLGKDVLNLLDSKWADEVRKILLDMRNPPPAISSAPKEWVDKLGELDVAARAKAHAEFIAEHGHAWISNGPYMIASVDLGRRVVTLERFG